MKPILVVSDTNSHAGEGDERHFADAAVRYAERLGVAVKVTDVSGIDRLDLGGFDGVIVNGRAWSAVDDIAGVPLVRVAFDGPPDDDGRSGARHGGPPATTIWGRGADGTAWAIRHLVWSAARYADAIPYGSHAEQVADLRLPDGPGPHPVAVVLHGGGWRSHWARDLMDGVAVDLTGRGFATWNVEYRRVGVTDGGWPETFDDIAAATDALAGLAQTHPLDLDRVIAVGHSAGGQLALWAAARPKCPAGAVGAGPAVAVRAVVCIAGVCDLKRAADIGVSRGAAVELLGGTPRDVPDRYDAASPIELLPIGVPQLLVHGDADDRVPVAMTTSYAETARASGDHVEVVVLPGADHFDVIDPATPAWHRIVTGMTPLLEGWPVNALATAERPS